MKVYIKNRQRTKKLNQQRIKKDLSRTLHLLSLNKTELSVLFINSRKMRSFNLLYRGIDRATDVLSFSQDDTTRKKNTFPESQVIEGYENRLLGDIVISVPFAQQQADDLGVPFYDELLRLMIHGLLHLLGYDHEVNKAQKKKMEKKEKELFDAVKTVA